MTFHERYLEIEYPEINLTYVCLLCDCLCKRYFAKPFASLVELGSGTGDYLRTFATHDLETYGIDKPYDLEKDKLPFFTDSIDYVFSKSVLEHISNTNNVLLETYRVLKPAGIVVFMVPDWTRQVKCFYDDSTHIKPFTQKGLAQAFKLAGFKNVSCEVFYQLPFIWRHPRLKFIPYVLSFLPDTTKYRGGKQNVLIRHSKERMLLLKASK